MPDLYRETSPGAVQSQDSAGVVPDGSSSLLYCIPLHCLLFTESKETPTELEIRWDIEARW